MTTFSSEVVTCKGISYFSFLDGKMFFLKEGEGEGGRRGCELNLANQCFYLENGVLTQVYQGR